MTVVAIYGGSFDPITCGHLILAFEVLNSGQCDQVWVMPSGDGREDKTARTKSSHRLAMCQAAVKEVLETRFITANGDLSGDSPIQVL